MEKQLKDYYIIKNNKKLAYGYTTGSCAAAAAKAALTMLLYQEQIVEVRLLTPFGITLYLAVEEIVQTKDFVCCAIRKDGGDDPDATHGMLIYAKVTFCKSSETSVNIDGGIGIGRVTKPGLDQPIGNAAINHVPREMIETQLMELLDKTKQTGTVSVEIYAPKGEEVAQRTLNARLGIIGGISILGTTGIVVPMSEEALVDTIQTEIKLHVAQKEEMLLFSPGNYGETFVDKYLHVKKEQVILCSNYIGKTIDLAVAEQPKEILFVSHIGKFIKLAGGIMDTHSKNGDCRAELFASCAMKADLPYEIVKQLLDSNTTEECVEMLASQQYLAPVMDIIMEQILYYLQKRAGDVKIGAIVFSSVYGFLGATKGIDVKTLLK